MTAYLTLDGALKRAFELARRNTTDYYVAQNQWSASENYRVLTRKQYLKQSVLPYRAIVSPEGVVQHGHGYSGRSQM